MTTPRLPAFVLEETKAPAMNDGRWADWARPVLAFLSEPRTWDQLLVWIKEERMNEFRLRHCLAFLEEKGLARTYGWRKELRWVASDYRGTYELTEAPRVPSDEDEPVSDTSPQPELSASDPTADSQTGT